MSDRTAVPPDQLAAQKFREIEDRLRTLETRGVPGNVALTTASVGDLTVEASATMPMRLNGSALWTQAIEYLGESGLPVPGQTGSNALVIRDELGAMRDAFPRQVVQVVGSSQSIAANIAIVVNWIMAAASGGWSDPAPSSQTWDAATNSMILTRGWWLLSAAIQYPVVNLDQTVREMHLEISTNGGVSWAAIAQDVRNGIGNAADVLQLYKARLTQIVTDGSRIRVSTYHRSATTPLVIVPVLFDAVRLRG